MSYKTAQHINKIANLFEAIVNGLIDCAELVILDAAGGKRSRRKARAPRPQRTRTVVYRARAPRVIYVKAA